VSGNRRGHRDHGHPGPVPSPDCLSSGK